ncbi:hypothetical protein BSU04_06410 [Caballeronia sordidicola]|uniref:Uncharacterized protein n=1 Tax=Caballeronia sordidicola TaxID=196367 RepID=A0A226X7X3_CABSO|nr:hypothetical protein BSU04_06410 [Caballeronia sordidicola]
MASLSAMSVEPRTYDKPSRGSICGPVCIDWVGISKVSSVGWRYKKKMKRHESDSED